MGMFRSVEMDLACERCGSAHRAEIQFKTGRDRCEDYSLGDRVEDLDASEEWEGIADRFCASCRADYRAERERAMAAVVAAAVRTGQLLLGLTETEAPLTAEEILARGAEKGEVARRSPLWFGSTMLLADLVFAEHEGTWSRRLPDAWWRRVFEALNEELRRRGWPTGDDHLREDLMVHLDEDRRIRVRLLPG